MHSIQTYYSKNSIIEVNETDDAVYARDCFDGSEKEWEEVREESTDGLFYVVSSGLQGCFMRDNVAVYGSREDALSAAKSEYEVWQEQDEEDEI